ASYGEQVIGCTAWQFHIAELNAMPLRDRQPELTVIASVSHVASWCVDPTATMDRRLIAEIDDDNEASGRRCSVRRLPATGKCPGGHARRGSGAAAHVQ